MRVTIKPPTYTHEKIVLRDELKHQTLEYQDVKKTQLSLNYYTVETAGMAACGGSHAGPIFLVAWLLPCSFVSKK